MIFSIPKFTGKALEFASNSIWLSGQKVVFFPWFMGMCYLMIMSCTFLKCQLDFGALKTQINPGCSLEGLMLKLKLQYFGHLMRRADSFEKTLPDAGKDWRPEEKGTTEDEMVGWHHWLNGHEFGWTPGVGDGQGGLVCCSPWGRKESDTTEQLNWFEDTNWSFTIPRKVIQTTYL